MNDEDIYAGVKFPLTEQEKRDLDETRRMAYIAYATLDTEYAGVEPDVAGTLANAVAHHSGLMSEKDAPSFARDLVNGLTLDMKLLDIIDACTDRLDEA